MERRPLHKRYHKGVRLPDGTWGPDCLALDHLLGPWFGEREDPRLGILREPGSRFIALSEIAHFEQGMPAELAFTPTVNTGIEAGPLLIDWILFNDAWRAHGGDLVPGTYQVHVPPGTQRSHYPSDHRLVTATVALPVELAAEDEWAMAHNSALHWDLAA